MIGLWSGSGERGGGERPPWSAGVAGVSAAKGPRVLVVDDERAILEMIEDILRAEGYEVAAAADGEEAIRLLERWRPAVLLLDMRMPGVDGWAVARAAHASQQNPRIVVMTAAENAARWAEEVSADAYLAKPFQLDELIACVGSVRGRREN